MTTVYGKEADTVDWGDEVDYSGYEWFKDPPPPPQVNLRLQGILDTRV